MMRKILSTSIFALLCFSGCVSQYSFVESPPFRVSRPVYQQVIAGREESAKQIKFSAQWHVDSEIGIRPDTLYFRDSAAPVDLEGIGESRFITAFFSFPVSKKEDKVMHANPREEAGNQPPYPLVEKSGQHFNLGPDEAVLQYRKAGSPRLFYYRIREVQEGPAIIRPSMPH